jgi:hypothetical protein
VRAADDVHEHERVEADYQRRLDRIATEPPRAGPAERDDAEARKRRDCL